jgi:hypothetical protein
MRLLVTAENAAGQTTAESAPSAIVQPLSVRARLSISPSPSCTGTPTVLNASGSQTPNLPIKRYRFTYVEYPALYPVETEQEYLSHFKVHVLADGSDPKPTVAFTWNREWTHELDFGDPAALAYTYVRDPVSVTVEVTDEAGATARTTQHLYFGLAAQGSTEGRRYCPDYALPGKQSTFELRPARLVIAGSTVTTTVKCTRAAPCAGTLSLLPVRSRIASAAGKAKRPVPMIAFSRFFSIAGHHSAVIHAKLTATGRRLLKRGRSVKAVERLTSIAPTGAARTHSLRVTLRRR